MLGGAKGRQYKAVCLLKNTTWFCSVSILDSHLYNSQSHCTQSIQVTLFLTCAEQITHTKEQHCIMLERYFRCLAQRTVKRSKFQ